MENNFKVIKPLVYGSIFTIVVLFGLLLFPIVAKGQSQHLPKIAWRTEAKNVTMLTDSTYRVDVFPLNINEPGVFIKGDYFKDYVGHTYEVIDSTFNTVDIWDCFNVGVGPQLDKEGVLYKSIDGAPCLAPIPYLHLNETALEYSRAIELSVLWRQANLYAQDSSYLVWWNDTIVYISTKYDIDTLHQKTIDSLLIHRTEIDELKNQSDSIQLLSDSLFYYVLTTTFEDSLLQLRGDMNSDFSTVSDSLSYYVLTTVFDDSLVIFRQDISDLQDTIEIHLDTLQSHNLRILVLSNNINQLSLDVYDSLNAQHGRISINESDIAAVYDSLTNIYTEAQVDALLSEINAHNDLQGDSISDLWAWNVNQSDSLDLLADSLFYYVLKTTFEDSLTNIRGTIHNNEQSGLDTLAYYTLTTVFNDSLLIFRGEVDNLNDAVEIHLDTLQSHNLRLLALNNSLSQLEIDLYDSLNTHQARIGINENNVSSLYDSLANIYTEAQVNAIISEINNRLLGVEGLDTTGIYHANRAIIDVIDETWNDFSEWNKDYFDLINRPNFQDSIVNYQTDNQQISIDSLGRRFTITLEYGGSISFIDTNTEYDLSPYATSVQLGDSVALLRSEIPTLLTQLSDAGFTITESQISDLKDYLIESDVSDLRDSVLVSFNVNKQQSDSLAILNDSLAFYVLKSVYEAKVNNLSDSMLNHEGRITSLEAFDESDPIYAGDSSNIVWWKDTITDISTKYDLDTLNQKTIDSLLIHRTEIDELKNRSDENSDLHVEVGRLKNLGNHSINVIFSKPFVNQPIGEEPQIYRIEKFKGNYRREKMLWGWTDANQPINTGFSLNIDNSESLANVVIEYTYIELLQDWILKTGFWNMQGTWKMDKTWKF